MGSSELQVGEEVIAVGHALGLKGGPTVSKGVIRLRENDRCCPAKVHG
ncbi:MAG: hypothetical protein CM1200mP3_05130 [Chloroflexota bacterium]|nr:MAG: hypothetical protein CM1200mP3_05130 [Chloroflexota bacterium]